MVMVVVAMVLHGRREEKTREEKRIYEWHVEGLLKERLRIGHCILLV